MIDLLQRGKSKLKIETRIEKPNFENFISEYLLSCGIENSKSYIETENINYETPFIYPNMETAVEKLIYHITHRSKIGVLVDMDADGLLSATIIVRLLKAHNADFKIVLHTEKAHGLSADVFSKILNEKFDLLIIPDASTNDTEQCKMLDNLGTNIIILDHHIAEKPNENAIIVNPYLTDEKIKINKCISGAGVASKFVEAFCERTATKPFYMKDLVAISLISDVCDMTYPENRKYFVEGIKDIKNKACQSVFAEFAKGETSYKSIGWQFAPRVNALTRIKNGNIVDVLKALITDEGIKECLTALKQGYNEQKKQVEKALAEIEIAEYSHSVFGVIPKEYRALSGLIANKLLGEKNKTVFAVWYDSETDTYFGSMRSAIDVYKPLNDSGLCVLQGHEKASGAVVPKANIEKINALIAEICDNADLDVVNVTAHLDVDINAIRLCYLLADLKDMWANNVKEPTFHFAFTATKDDVKLYKKRTTTLKIQKGNLTFVKFNCPQSLVNAIESAEGYNIELTATLGINEFGDELYPQGTIEKIELNFSNIAQ